MSDSQRPRKIDESACEKFWEIYLNEAQRYDEGLIKSWKEDMDVTLVFSGLYSAVLTAFVIQSYQELQQDQTELSAKYLWHISQQLSGTASNVTALPSSDVYSPAVSVVICNVLWFMSLTLALTCAFLATLVQQWARHFLHRTTILRSSTARARLLQFLYFGIKDMKLHTLVDVIPFLLHVSLFLFLAGLVAFLIGVSSGLAWLMLSVLCAIIVMYTTFTVLPLIKLNSPFQTPLSQFVWRLWRQSTHYIAQFRQLKEFKSRRIHETLSPSVPSSHPPTTDHTAADPEVGLPLMTASQRTSSTNKTNSLTEANTDKGMMDAIIVTSQSGNPVYESASSTWILKSLNNDTELLTFVESLTDALYGDDGIRSANLHLVRPLLDSSDCQTRIIPRTQSLLANCAQPWFDEMHKKRCREACPKLLWILAIIMMPSDSSRLQLVDTERWVKHHFPFSPELLKNLFYGTGSLYVYSSLALCSLQLYRTCKMLLSMRLTDVGLNEIQVLIKACPKVLRSYCLSDVKLERNELLRNVEEHMSYTFSQFLWSSCRNFPGGFRVTVSTFRSYKIDIPEAFVARVFLQLTKCLHDITSRGIDEPQRRKLLVGLDDIFKVAFENWRLETESSSTEANPTLYITHRISTEGWQATTIIWCDPFDWNVEFFKRLELLLRRPHLHLGMIDILQELLFSLASELEEYGLQVNFWFSTLSILNVPSPKPYRLAFCIRMAAVVGVAMDFPHSSDLNPIVEDARRYIASDEALATDRPEEFPETIHFLLLLRLFRDMDSFGSEDDLQIALLWYCTLKSPCTSSQPREPMILALGELAKHTKHITKRWLESHTWLTLDILHLVFSIWTGLLSHFHSANASEDAGGASNLIPLAEAIESLLSSESRNAIEDIQSSAEWRVRTRKLNNLRLSISDLCPTLESCRKDVKFALPYVIPLPNLSEDEAI